MDIPEAHGYILSYVKTLVYKKEMNPLLTQAINDLAEEQTLLETTLAAMIPDTSNEIEADFSPYEEHN
jgi:hypothetical protein